MAAPTAQARGVLALGNDPPQALVHPRVVQQGEVIASPHDVLAIFRQIEAVTAIGMLPQRTRDRHQAVAAQTCGGFGHGRGGCDRVCADLAWQGHRLAFPARAGRADMAVAEILDAGTAGPADAGDRGAVRAQREEAIGQVAGTLQRSAMVRGAQESHGPQSTPPRQTV